MTTFAKGLVSGTIQAPAKTSWWPRHIRSLMRNLALAGMKTSEKKPNAWYQLESIAKEWESLCPKAAQHGLMLEHTLLEIALLDAVMKDKVEEIDTIGKKLFDNASEVGAVLGISIPQFPESLFKRLFDEHVSLYAGAVRRKIEGVVVTSGDMEQNTLALADLTAEWL